MDRKRGAELRERRRTAAASGPRAAGSRPWQEEPAGEVGPRLHLSGGTSNQHPPQYTPSAPRGGAHVSGVEQLSSSPSSCLGLGAGDGGNQWRILDTAYLSRRWKLRRNAERRVRILFRSSRLQECADDETEASRRWGGQTGRAYILRMRRIEAASSFQSLYDVRSMNLHPLMGNRRGQFAIRLTGRMRLIVEPGQDADEIIVLEVSKHYGD